MGFLAGHSAKEKESYTVTRHAMAGGVQGDFAFLRGKRVAYWGRTGDQHIEWVPGVLPDWPRFVLKPGR